LRHSGSSSSQAQFPPGKYDFFSNAPKGRTHLEGTSGNYFSWILLNIFFFFFFSLSSRIPNEEEGGGGLSDVTHSRLGIEFEKKAHFDVLE
jgi:hypothetical protein